MVTTCLDHRLIRQRLTLKMKEERHIFVEILHTRVAKPKLMTKNDLKAIFEKRTTNWKSLDYVAGWFMKAVDYGSQTNSSAAFVSTNSICQGRQVETLWSLILQPSMKYPLLIRPSNGQILLATMRE